MPYINQSLSFAELPEFCGLSPKAIRRAIALDIFPRPGRADGREAWNLKTLETRDFAALRAHEKELLDPDSLSAKELAAKLDWHTGAISKLRREGILREAFAVGRRYVYSQKDALAALNRAGIAPTGATALRKARADPNLIGSSRLARLFGFTRNSIDNFRNRGILPAPIKIGGRFFFPRQKALDALEKLGGSEVARDYYTRDLFRSALGLSMSRFNALRESGEIPPPIFYHSELRWPANVVREFVKTRGRDLSPRLDPDLAKKNELALFLGLSPSTINNLRERGILRHDAVYGKSYLYSISRIRRELARDGLDKVLDDYRTSSEFARDLGVSQRRFNHWKAAGKLPAAIDFLGNPRWPGEVVREFLKNPPKVASKPEPPDEGEALSFDGLAKLLSIPRHRAGFLTLKGLIEPDGLAGSRYYFKRSRVLSCLKRRGLSEVAQDFFTRREMTFVLKVSSQRLLELIKEGRVPAPLDFFGQKRWPRSRIREFLAENPKL